jgi:hypothetical protein
MFSLAAALAALAGALFVDSQQAQATRERHITGTIASYDPASGRMVLEVLTPGRIVLGPMGVPELVAESQYIPILMPQAMPPFISVGFPLAVIAIEDERGVLYAQAAYPGGGETPQMPGLPAPEWEQDPGYELPPLEPR